MAQQRQGNMMEKNRRSVDDFMKEAQGRQAGIWHEFGAFIRHTRKWWLAPIVALLLLVGLVVILGGTAVAPLIYTLF